MSLKKHKIEASFIFWNLIFFVLLQQRKRLKDKKGCKLNWSQKRGIKKEICRLENLFHEKQAPKNECCILSLNPSIHLTSAYHAYLLEPTDHFFIYPLHYNEINHDNEASWLANESFSSSSFFVYRDFFLFLFLSLWNEI